MIPSRSHRDSAKLDELGEAKLGVVKVRFYDLGVELHGLQILVTAPQTPFL